MSGIQAAIADHFKMLFGDVPDETFYEIQNRQSFFHILFIFVTVIVESNGIAVIPVNPGSGNYCSAKIAADVFSHNSGIGESWFCIDIEALFMLGVTVRFYCFERRSDPVFQFIEKSSTESVTEIVVVKVFDMTPESIITVAAFGKDAVYVWVPFEVAAKSMKGHDIAWGKIFGMVQVEKHPCNYTGDGMEEAVQERTVLKEENTEVFINGKNAMALWDMEEFKRHTSGAFHGIFVAAGRTKAAVTAKRDKLKFAAMGTAIHGTAEGRITAVDHFIDIIHLSISGMKSIFNFLIMVCKDSL